MAWASFRIAETYAAASRRCCVPSSSASGLAEEKDVTEKTLDLRGVAGNLE